MKKTLIGIIAIAIAATTYAFGGPGTDRQGNKVDVTQNVSRPANVTIAHGKGASQRDNLYQVKRATRLRRLSTRSNTSRLLSKPRYMGSKEASMTSIYKVPETLLEKFHRILSERRAAKKLIREQ